MKSLIYYPELNSYTGSITSSLLFMQLEYWFKVTRGKTFYKFLEPCEAPQYVTGDSWTEELSFGKTEFRTAFSNIGKVYKSKKAYLESKDKFEGKYYLSYYDRIKRLTYYERNETLVNTLLRNLNLSFGYSETKPIKSIQNTSSDIESDVKKLFETYCPSLNAKVCFTLTTKMRLHTLVKVITTKGLNLLETFKSVFCQVEASDFLCGRLSTSTFLASLSWILKPDKFFAILEGNYAPFVSSMPDSTFAAPALSSSTSQVSSCAGSPCAPLSTLSAPSTTPFVKPTRLFNRMYTHNFDIEALEAKERAWQEAKYEANLHNTSTTLL